ncbi:MAG: hypothetical protein JWQ74_2863 [Marmoricola sp.]|nr:hypothetical protein [Marmoricola sp.]
MSDEIDDTRPRPRPVPLDKAETVTPEAADAPAAEPVESEPAIKTTSARPTPGPVSAASRARRIGGLPTAPTPSDEAPAKRRPAPPAPAPSPSAPGAAPQAAKPPKPPKPAKEPKPPKEPRKARAGGEPRSGALLSWVPSGVLAAAAVVLVVCLAIAGHGVYYGKDGVSAGQRNTFQQQVLAAAKTCLAAINTYDYRKVPTAEAAALACTTGPFTASLKNTYEKTIKVKAPPAKAVQTAQVNEAGIRSVSPDGKQVDVLVIGQLAITNVQTTSGTPTYDPFGTVVTLDKVGSKWLIARYESDTGS